MSIDLHYRIYKGLSEAEFKEAASELVQKCGGELIWCSNQGRWDQKMTMVANDDFLTVLIPYQNGGSDFWLCKAIGEKFDVEWMELRLQREALWDYSLYKGDNHLHDFSAMPQYWRQGREVIKNSRGDVKQLCEVWGCNEECVKNYLRRWRMAFPWYYYFLFWTDWIFKRPLLSGRNLDHWYWKMHTYHVIWPRGRAYKADEHEYGDAWQLLDFRKALGAPSDQEAKGRLQWHYIELPSSKQFCEAVAGNTDSRSE